MYHLSCRDPKNGYRLEGEGTIEVGATTIHIARKVRSSEILIGLAIYFTDGAGKQRSSVCNMTQGHAQRLLDVLIGVLYDNSE